MSAAVSKIDVHAHYLPADYREALIANGHTEPDGFPVLPEWSAEAHLAMMDRVGIGTSMLSVSSPGVGFGEDPAAWARRVNDAGARTVRDHPGRFGLLASLPLPDVEAARVELAYALDDLGADGVVLLTNVDGVTRWPLVDQTGHDRDADAAVGRDRSRTAGVTRSVQAQVRARGQRQV